MLTAPIIRVRIVGFVIKMTPPPPSPRTDSGGTPANSQPYMFVASYIYIPGIYIPGIYILYIFTALGGILRSFLALRWRPSGPCISARLVSSVCVCVCVFFFVHLVL